MIPSLWSAVILGTLMAMIVVWSCSVPTLQSDDRPFEPCKTCPSHDASNDTQPTDILVDSPIDAGNRNPLCGTDGCIPDLQANDTQCPQTEGLTCRITSGEALVPVATCSAIGPGSNGDGCQSPSDCGPGLTCVARRDDPSTGVCRAYACLGQSSCDDGFFLSVRPERDPRSELSSRFLPVCTPATNCRLLEPGECGPSEACMLVADRTTTCQRPGTGQAGERCPCAAEHVCARELNLCQKLCLTGRPQACPDGQVCIFGGQALPDGIGVCVPNVF